LILVNGRRMTAGGASTQAPDVSQIPTIALQSVDVLTGGASATYGADAVAGVVNFVTRRMDGIEMRLGYSGYRHDNSNGFIQPLLDARGFDTPPALLALMARTTRSIWPWVLISIMAKVMQRFTQLGVTRQNCVRKPVTTHPVH
jgi:iron complex outermembrane receptor protein